MSLKTCGSMTHTHTQSQPHLPPTPPTHGSDDHVQLSERANFIQKFHNVISTCNLIANYFSASLMAASVAVSLTRLQVLFWSHRVSIQLMILRYFPTIFFFHVTASSRIYWAVITRKSWIVSKLFNDANRMQMPLTRCHGYFLMVTMQCFFVWFFIAVQSRFFIAWT